MNYSKLENFWGRCCNRP